MSGDRPDVARGLNASIPFFGSRLRTHTIEYETAPMTRTEYFTPGEWTLTSHGPGLPHVSENRTLTAGRNEPLHRDRAVVGPTFRGTVQTGKEIRPCARRSGDTIDVVLPMLRHDAAGYLTLRTRATDADGDSVEQVILRAYRVR